MIFLPNLYKEKFPEMTKLYINLVMPPLLGYIIQIRKSTYKKNKWQFHNITFEEAEAVFDIFRDDFKIWCLLFLDNGKKLSNIFCLPWMKEILAQKMLQVLIWHQIWDLLQKYDKQYFLNKRNKIGTIKKFFLL